MELVDSLALGLGDNSKPRILAILIEQERPRPLSARDLAERLGVSESTARRAAENLVRARFIRKIDGHPSSYWIDDRLQTAWLRVLSG